MRVVSMGNGYWAIRKWNYTLAVHQYLDLTKYVKGEILWMAFIAYAPVGNVLTTNKQWLDNIVAKLTG